MTELSLFGDFEVDADSRTLRGILLPFGETSRKSTSGHVAHFEADDITLPRDVSVISINRRHNRHDPVGRATVLEKRTEGVYAEFRIADTDEGDAYLNEERDSLRKLSPEVLFASDNKHARLTGAALVTEGAFASAGLFEIANEDEEEKPAAEVADETPDADPAQEEEETTNGEVMTSVVPDAPGATPVVKDDAAALFAAVANANANPDALEPFRNAGALFAVNQIQETGPSGRTIYTDTYTPAAIGELWSKQAYSQRFMPLISSANLTSTTVRGWRWVQGPEVADYAGNLAEVPSNVVDTEPVTTEALRLAGGHKIDRKFYDFNDQAVIESYFRLQTEDVARKLDAKALAAITSAATVTTPGTVPSGVAKGLAAIVDGALSIVGTENRPSFAIVSPELYRDIALTKDNDKLAFLNAGFGLEEGDFASFKIVPGNIGTGKVIVGAREAVTFYVLPQTPIRIEGLDIHRGGVDVAVFAYYASIVNNAAAVRSVTVA